MNIAIIENSNQQWIDARELHNELEINKDYTNWFKYQIDRGGFIQGKDYNKVKPDEVYAINGKQGGRPSAIYIITIETAKHISMMSQTSKGKLARNWFIGIEKKYHSQDDNSIVLKAFQILQTKTERLANENKVLVPKGEFYDAVASSKDLLTMGETAKLIGGIGRNDLYKLLRIKFILMRRGVNHNLPFQKYIDNGYFKVIENHFKQGFHTNITTKPMVTQKGLEYLTKLVKND